MANTVSYANVKTFEDNVRFLAQQKGSKFRPYVQTRNTKAESHSWSRVGTIEAITKVGRAVDSPIQDTPFSARVATPTTKNGGDLVEPEDIVQMLIDPTSSISTELGYALGRAYDDLVIAAATGNAIDSTGASNAFPTAQIVNSANAGSITAAGGALTTEYVAVIQEQFWTNNIDPDEPKVIFVGPGQMQNLIQIEKATSDRYVNSKVLAETGVVHNWMGFTWRLSTRLTQATAGSTICLAMTEKAMGFMMDKDIWVECKQRPDKSFAWQVYGAFTGGAVRVEDEHIVAAVFLNAAAAGTAGF